MGLPVAVTHASTNKRVDTEWQRGERERLRSKRLPEEQIQEVGVRPCFSAVNDSRLAVWSSTNGAFHVIYTAITAPYTPEAEIFFRSLEAFRVFVRRPAAWPSGTPASPHLQHNSHPRCRTLPTSLSQQIKSHTELNHIFLSLLFKYTLK